MTVGRFKLRKVVYEVFNTLWQQQIPTYPKADTYKLFKNKIKLEKYLTIIDNRKKGHVQTIWTIRPQTSNRRGQEKTSICPQRTKNVPTVLTRGRE